MTFGPFSNCHLQYEGHSKHFALRVRLSAFQTETGNEDARSVT